MKVLVFSLVFMIVQYLLILSEWRTYSDMLSDIQTYTFNFYRNEKGEFIHKNIIIYTIVYFLISIFIYYYMILPKKGYFEIFLFVSTLYAAWDAALYLCFDKGDKYPGVLAYDTFVVGGVGLTLAAYLFYNFYDILRAYLPLLVVAYFASMGWFLYDTYLYANPPPDFAAMFKR